VEGSITEVAQVIELVDGRNGGIAESRNGNRVGRHLLRKSAKGISVSPEAKGKTNCVEKVFRVLWKPGEGVFRILDLIPGKVDRS
jgi:hypothetical protein